MKRKVLLLAAIVILVGFQAAPASADPVSCTSTESVGNLGPPGLISISNSFSSPTNYTDCYQFTLSSAAASFGGAIEVNSFFNSVDLEISSVSLFAGGSLLGVDTSPLFFSFGPLTSGFIYTLAVAGSVISSPGLITVPASYYGLFATQATTVASVPEPATLLLTALGIGSAVPFIRRRRRSIPS